MPRRIGTADDHAFLVPIHSRPHVGGAITQSQAAAAAIGIIGLGPMQQQVVVNRNLSRLQLDVDRLAELFCIFDGLVKRVSFVLFLSRHVK